MTCAWAKEAHRPLPGEPNAPLVCICPFFSMKNRGMTYQTCPEVASKGARLKQIGGRGQPLKKRPTTWGGSNRLPSPQYHRVIESKSWEQKNLRCHGNKVVDSDTPLPCSRLKASEGRVLRDTQHNFYLFQIITQMRSLCGNAVWGLNLLGAWGCAVGVRGREYCRVSVGGTPQSARMEK